MNLTTCDYEAHNLFIDFKDERQRKKLIRPSENLVIAVGEDITPLEDFLKSNAHKPAISKRAQLHLQKINFSWLLCTSHQEVIQNNILAGICRIGIPWYCKRENLKNKDARATKRKLQKTKH